MQVHNLAEEHNDANVRKNNTGIGLPNKSSKSYRRKRRQEAFRKFCEKEKGNDDVANSAMP